jgi:hypothetical protein
MILRVSFEDGCDLLASTRIEFTSPVMEAIGRDRWDSTIGKPPQKEQVNKMVLAAMKYFLAHMDAPEVG